MLLNISVALRNQILMQKTRKNNGIDIGDLNKSDLVKIVDMLPIWIKTCAETCSIISIPKQEFNELPFEVQEHFVAVPFRID